MTIRDSVATLAPLVIVGLMALLASPTSGIKCYTSIGGMVKTNSKYSMEDCGDSVVGCYENFQALGRTNKVIYKAGCGRFTSAPGSALLQVMKRVLDQGTKDCLSDGCNQELLADIEKRYRVCRWAQRSKSYTDVAIICPKNVSKCFLDSMVGASEPLYFAGCGECPSYTLYCTTCTKNYCNGTVKPSRVVYVEEESDEEWFSDDEQARDAADSGRSCGTPVVLAAITWLLALALH